MNNLTYDNNTIKILTIRRPDDWHIHLRDGEILKVVVPCASEIFHRVIVMPNLIPPITTMNSAINYRQRILNAVPKQHSFIPLMTYHLSDIFDLHEIENGFKEKLFIAAKMYFSNVTTNTNYGGVTNIDIVMPALERMEKIGMPLLVHGEISCNDIDIFDREARFIDKIMHPLRRRLQELKIVFEHISTKDAVEYIRDGDTHLAATITPQHLMFNRNHMLSGGIRPHLYCLPILKRKEHQTALRKLIASGFERVFLGTDSAPHLQHYKESNCGCAGCFNTPSALSIYATVFEEMNALMHLEAFCSLNGPRFYGLSPNKEILHLYKKKTVIKSIAIKNHFLVPLLEKKVLNWQIVH